MVEKTHFFFDRDGTFFLKSNMAAIFFKKYLNISHNSNISIHGKEQIMLLTTFSNYAPNLKKIDPLLSELSLF